MDKISRDNTYCFRLDIDSLAKNFEEILDNIESREDENKYLREENKRLKDDAYKDTELAEMKKQLETARADLRRGFGISEKEDKKIKEWQQKHEEEVHGVKPDKILYRGAAGGGYTYEFYPTGIGTFGTVKCSCGAKFDFQEL